MEQLGQRGRRSFQSPTGEAGPGTRAPHGLRWAVPHDRTARRRAANPPLGEVCPPPGVPACRMAGRPHLPEGSPPLGGLLLCGADNGAREPGDRHRGQRAMWRALNDVASRDDRLQTANFRGSPSGLTTNSRESKPSGSRPPAQRSDTYRPNREPGFPPRTHASAPRSGHTACSPPLRFSRGRLGQNGVGNDRGGRA